MLRSIVNTAITLFLMVGTESCNTGQRSTATSTDAVAATNELIYHVFQRSFYDSNGDLHGDLNGLKQKLDYL